jgi:hypothetical protein
VPDLSVTYGGDNANVNANVNNRFNKLEFHIRGTLGVDKTAQRRNNAVVIRRAQPKGNPAVCEGRRRGFDSRLGTKPRRF